METAYSKSIAALRAQPQSWLVTGCAGFIGSHLLESLLQLGQRVTGMDDFSTGTRDRLEEVRERVGPKAWARFRFLESSICQHDDCVAACARVDFVLHHAGFISVPKSIHDPLGCNAINVDGFLRMLIAAREAGVERFIYASSSSVYGETAALPNNEEDLPQPISPYGVSKLVDELYAAIFTRAHATSTIGFRYFNVFGSRQEPAGSYAAAVPAWITNLLRGRLCALYGEGGRTRDFCHVADVVQANILAATSPAAASGSHIFNIGSGSATTLTELYRILRDEVATVLPEAGRLDLMQMPAPASGDISHSLADISKARRELGYEPRMSLKEGLREAIPWYAQRRFALNPADHA